MPRDSAGVYVLPTGYRAVTGQTVLASQHNPPLEDLASAMTGSLPRSGAAPMLGPANFGGFKVMNIAAGTAAGDAVNKSQLDAAIPSGTVVDFAGSTAPLGWLFCYGQAVSRADYAALFSALGTTYGTGDGSTTFNLPDCRGRATAGRDNMGGTSANRLAGISGSVNGDVLGAAGGKEGHTLIIAEMPAHDHGGATGLNGAHSHTYVRAINTNVDFGTDSPYGATFANSTTSAVPSHNHGIPSQGSGTAHSSIQPTIILNKIIKF